MTINLELSPQTQQRLEALASKSGQPIEAYVNALIEKTVAPIDKILAPFRQGFAESGLTEEEATNLLDAELKAVRAERRTKSLS
jgi:predicted transcriptional regulator